MTSNGGISSAVVILESQAGAYGNRGSGGNEGGMVIDPLVVIPKKILTRPAMRCSILLSC